MKSLFREVIGNATLVALGCAVLAGLFVFLDGVTMLKLEQAAIFYKVFATLVLIIVFSILVLLCSLTLGTRYNLVGVIGIVFEAFSLVAIAGQIWVDTSGSFGPAKASEPTGSLIESAGGQLLSTFVIVVGLVAIALPLINMILFAGSRNAFVIEVAALSTVLLLIVMIILCTIVTVQGEWDEGVGRLVGVMGTLLVGGIIGVPIAGGTRIIKALPHRNPVNVTSDR